MKSKTFAVLVDGENISPKDFKGVVREVEKNGDVAIQRVYADWTQPHRAGWKEILHETGARPVHQFNYGKDAADHALIMDAIELTISNPRIDAVCIVSSDGGFHTLAQRVREKGLYVMGIGKRNTPTRLRRACHHFVYTDLLEKDEHEPVVAEEQSLEELLIRAYRATDSDGEAVYLGQLGTQLKKLDPAFDPRSYSFPSLKALIKANAHLFEMESETHDRCFISLKHGAVPEETNQVTEGVVRRWLGHYGFIDAAHGSYYFAKVNVIQEQRDRRLKSGDKVRFVVAKHPEPAAEHSSDQNGKAKEIEVISDSFVENEMAQL